MALISPRSLPAAVALAATVVGASPGVAQTLQAWPSARFAVDSVSRAKPMNFFPSTGPLRRLDSLPCPDCNPPKRFWAGAGELMLVQFIPWAFTRYVTDGEWARISPHTWATNLKFAWQWDNNKFSNNQFAHPYHGSLYFNSGRSNGYTFWQSVPWAFGGSLMWELFGEVFAPAPNDLLNTSLGGITLGEMLFRFSSLTLKNEATGSNRVVREVGAGLINPVRGFNRLVRGETGRISETPPDWRPTRIQATMDAGYRRFDGTVPSGEPIDQPYLQFSVVYGDQLTDLDKAPFSSFVVTGTLAPKSEARGRLSDLRVRGNLAAKPVGSSDHYRLAGFMTYEYISNPVVDFGGQGFQGGIVARSDMSKAWRFSGEALARAMPIAAIRSDYFVTAEGRDYDYGIGLGGRVEGRAILSNQVFTRLSLGYIALPVISGFSGTHHLFTLNTEARGYIHGKFGAGVEFTRLNRTSNYMFNPDVKQHFSELRLFLSLAMPRWQE